MSSREQLLGMFSTDQDLVVRVWDPRLEEPTGIKRAAAQGAHLSELVPRFAERGMDGRFQKVLQNGTVEVLSTAFHRFLIPCPPPAGTTRFEQMQQKVTIAPLRSEGVIVGTLVTLEDVTLRLEHEALLAERLHSSDPAERLKAAEELAASEPGSPHLLEAAGSGDWRVRRAALGGIVRSGAEAVADLLRMMRDEHGDINVISSTLAVLSMSHIDAFDALLLLLEDADAYLRMYVAQLLGERRDPRAIPPLLAALDDADTNVRYHVIEALGRLQAQEAGPRLAEIAAAGDFFLSFPALDALRSLGDATVVAGLSGLLEHDLLGGATAELFAAVGDVEVVPPLARLLDRSPQHAITAATALNALSERYEKFYREGAHIADLARRQIGAPGVGNLISAVHNATSEELRPLTEVIGWLEVAEAERALVELLGNPRTQKPAVEALVRSGSRVIDLLVEALEKPDGVTRRAVVIALGRIGDPRAVPALQNLLYDEDEPMVLAIGALAKIGGPDAFDSLLNLCGHPSLTIRQAVVGALNSLGDPRLSAEIRKRLSSLDPLVRESATRVAGYFCFSECMERLIELCDDVDDNVRCAAIEHLAFADDPQSLSKLLQAATSSDPRSRVAAMRAMMYADDPLVRSCLLEALVDSDPWVRFFAVKALGRNAWPDALDALKTVVHEDSARQVVLAGLEALGRVGGVRAVALLVPFTDHAEDDLARAAITALGEIEHPDVLPSLVAMLHHDEPFRRQAAVEALARHGGESAVAPLQWLAATDHDEQVTQSAISSLTGLGCQSGIAALVDVALDDNRREACLVALSRLDRRYIPLLCALLTDDNPATRLLVVEALARRCHPESSEGLLSALDDADCRVRLAAVRALGALGNRLVERRLDDVARNDRDASVRKEARRLLDGFRGV